MSRWRRRCSRCAARARGGDFLPLEQQRVVAISCVLRSRDGLTVWSLGEPGTAEAELVQRFYDGIEKYSPDLVSWNGSGFDLPVLTYRALLHGVQARALLGDRRRGSGVPLQQLPQPLSLAPHRSHGRAVRRSRAAGGPRCPAWRRCSGCPASSASTAARSGRPSRPVTSLGIRRYCETDVLNTWLIWLRFAQLRAALSREQHAEEIARVKSYLRASPEPHFAQFLRAWEAGA